MGTVIRSLLAALAGSAALVATVTAVASAPPVGALPPGPTASVVTHPGRTFTIRLPKSTVAGRVWRVARAYDAAIVREVAEGETSSAVRVRFRARKVGVTRIVYALTLGEGRHAYAARRFAIYVR